MPSQWKRQQVVIRRMLGGRRPRRVARVRPRTTPGTLIPPDSAPSAPVRITVMHYTPEGLSENEAKTAEECLEWIGRPGVTWINVDGLGQPEVLARLGEQLHFHPLAPEDVFT